MSNVLLIEKLFVLLFYSAYSIVIWSLTIEIHYITHDQNYIKFHELQMG